jgi:hypothetical protein
MLYLRQGPPVAASRLGYRPNLETLEERAVPSHSRLAAGPATKLLVSGLTRPRVGEPALVRVVALDAANHRTVNYAGTVHFTSSDSAARLPADYIFRRRDRGVHFFRVTFGTAGAQTVTVTDTRTPTITGVRSTTVTAAPVVTHFQVGEPTRVTVVALDASNRRVPSYTGTVDITSTDSAARLPADFTFRRRDRGIRAFAVTFGTQGPQTITATDTANRAVSGSSASVTVSPPAVATQLAVIASPFARSGRNATVIVTALDASGRRVRGYTGTVTFSSTDSAATLPAAYQFTTADRGRHVFRVRWATSGEQTLSIVDNSATPLRATATIFVSPMGFFGLL